MNKRILCPWCIQGLSSHGIKIYVGDYVEAKCDECGDEDDCRECIEEDWYDNVEKEMHGIY